MKNILNLPFFYLLFLSGFLNSALNAQTAPQIIADSLQSILDNAQHNGFTHPGVIMKISVPGQWTWSGASGFAISGQSAGQPQTSANSTMKFRTGSITKNMVAVCILKLQEDGLLNINDPIANYLRPTLVNDTILSSDTVTIRQLLNHTSGIANSADNTSCQLNVLSNPLGSHTLEEAVYCGTSQGELFPPGTAWSYSNTNYSLLAMIIESLSGMSYAAFLNQEIIQALNLQNTEIPASSQISGAHMGCYWFLGANPWTDLTLIHPSTYTGWADLVSTTEDLITYYTALRNGQILNSTELSLMYSIDAASFDYGMGIDFYQVYGSSYVGHYGEVGNSSGLFYADINSTLAPNGYYIAYNFNTQGSAMRNLIDKPVMNLLKYFTISENEIVKNTTFSMSPNPASNAVQFCFTAGDFDTIRIFDLLGRSVECKQIESYSTNLSLNLSALPRGTYFVSMSGENSYQRQTLILK